MQRFAAESCVLVCRETAENTMANWLTAVGFWEGQMLRRILTAWRAQGGQQVLTALAHWESSQSGLGAAFRWWRRVVVHLRNADHIAQQHRQQHASRGAFQASPLANQISINADDRVSYAQLQPASPVSTPAVRDMLTSMNKI